MLVPNWEIYITFSPTCSSRKINFPGTNFWNAKSLFFITKWKFYYLQQCKIEKRMVYFVKASTPSPELKLTLRLALRHSSRHLLSALAPAVFHTDVWRMFALWESSNHSWYASLLKILSLQLPQRVAGQPWPTTLAEHEDVGIVLKQVLVLQPGLPQLALLSAGILFTAILTAGHSVFADWW